MCLMVYLASKCPLPTSAWDENQRGFHVTDLHAGDEPVRPQFSKPYVYYVGSNEGCGCGFQYGQYRGIEEEPAELASAEDSRRQLANFLEAALHHQEEVELLACWDGDQAAEPERHRRLLFVEWSLNLPYLRERELLTISGRLEEADYWARLEFRVCREFAGMKDRHLQSLWCDGFIPHQYELDGPSPWIRGEAWICMGKKQEQWEFILLLSDPVQSREKIDWVSLLPDENRTRWLSLDKNARRITIEPKAASPDDPPG